MHDELARLIGEHPLPPDVAAPALYADVVTIAGVEVHRVGLASRAAGVEVTGSAAETSGPPLSRAYFELLERAAVMGAEPGPEPDASAPSRPARSNGVALHRSWEEACLRARLELIERDRVLRSWYGELAPSPAPVPTSLARFATHEWCACRIPEPRDGDVEVAAIIGFPREPGGPLARGFAARASLDEALEAAALEALQGLAFLWEEPLPEAAPEPSPSPMFHLDYYLWPENHAHLRAWLSGAHTRRGPGAAARSEPIRYEDLTPPALAGGLRVARARCPSARPLLFGDASPSLAAGLPGSHIHPIC